MNLQYLADQGRKLDGTQMAAELTNLLQREFGSRSSFVDTGAGTSLNLTMMEMKNLMNTYTMLS